MTNKTTNGVPELAGQQLSFDCLLDFADDQFRAWLEQTIELEKQSRFAGFVFLRKIVVKSFLMWYHSLKC